MRRKVVRNTQFSLNIIHLPAPLKRFQKTFIQCDCSKTYCSYSVKSLGRFHGNHFYQWPVLVKSPCYLKKKKTTVMHEMLYLDCRITLANFTVPRVHSLRDKLFPVSRVPHMPRSNTNRKPCDLWHTEIIVTFKFVKPQCISFRKFL